MDVSLLNEERKRQKLSIAELASKANLPKGTVEKVLFGVVQNPRIDTMEAIEKALGISSRSEWSEEERAHGVGKHQVFLSEEDWQWLELRNDILQIKGQEFLHSVEVMLHALIKDN